jgi:hypothetical protein
MHSGCLFYYGLTVNSLTDIIKTVLWIAKEEIGCDAYTVMTVMDNEQEFFAKELGFLYGDGALHYYLVNWSLGNKTVTSNDIATMLI